jgi:SWI/SNF-related matrix-associated actin-dependent regulator of chromatin subfamily B protein 1
VPVAAPAPSLGSDAIDQHETYINGKWHCANCGGPEGVVSGRRKGPAGDKTLCGDCGESSPSIPCWLVVDLDHSQASTTRGTRRTGLACTRLTRESTGRCSGRTKRRSGSPRPSRSVAPEVAPTPTRPAAPLSPGL